MFHFLSLLHFCEWSLNRCSQFTASRKNFGVLPFLWCSPSFTLVNQMAFSVWKVFVLSPFRCGLCCVIVHRKPLQSLLTLLHLPQLRCHVSESLPWNLMSGLVPFVCTSFQCLVTSNGLFTIPVRLYTLCGKYCLPLCHQGLDEYADIYEWILMPTCHTLCIVCLCLVFALGSEEFQKNHYSSRNWNQEC